MPDQIKEAFSKVKQDIELLKTQLDYLTEEIAQLKRTQENNPTYQAENQTLQHTTPTHHSPLEALKSPKTPFSTGNDGVPTNKPTNQRIGNEGVSDRINHLERVSEILNSLDAL